VTRSGPMIALPPRSTEHR